MREEIYKDIKFIIGQNAQENWDIFDQSYKINSEYIWFHLNSFASPYVIMYATLKELELEERQELLIYGAQLCKENSKYNYLNNLKIIYCPLKKLKKTDKIGEILISGKKNIIKL